jgi:hypothetical protein
MARAQCGNAARWDPCWRPDAVRADARRFHQLVTSQEAKARTAALFAQGLQTRGSLEVDLGDRIGAL